MSGTQAESDDDVQRRPHERQSCLPMSRTVFRSVFAADDGGLARNRTGVQGFAVLCVTTPPRGQSAGITTYCACPVTGRCGVRRLRTLRNRRSPIASQALREGGSIAVPAQSLYPAIHSEGGHDETLCTCNRPAAGRDADGFGTWWWLPQGEPSAMLPHGQQRRQRPLPRDPAGQTEPSRFSCPRTIRQSGATPCGAAPMLLSTAGSHSRRILPEGLRKWGR